MEALIIVLLAAVLLALAGLISWLFVQRRPSQQGAESEARRFEQLTDTTLRFIQEIERVTEAPVSLIATRFHHRSIIDRRAW